MESMSKEMTSICEWAIRYMYMYMYMYCTVMREREGEGRIHFTVYLGRFSTYILYMHVFSFIFSDFTVAFSSFHFSSSYLPGVSVFIFNMLTASSNTDRIMLSFKTFIDQNQSKFDTKVSR